MLSASDLAQKLHDSLLTTRDGYGNTTPVSTQTSNYAAGLVAALQAAVVVNAPGTIVGVTAPGAPLSAGAGTAGVMTITPGPMIAQSTAGIAPQAVAKLTAENTAVIAYIATGLVTFSPESITGTCTNTPLSPGPLVDGAGSNGVILGLTGVACLAAVGSALGSVGPGGLPFYTALINYVLANAEATYATGSVTGVCPPGGGPLVGAGVGGTIS